MKKTADRKIARRAYLEIQQRSGKSGICAEAERIGISPKAVYAWAALETAPSIYALQALCLAGYDVVYILTGKRQ